MREKFEGRLHLALRILIGPGPRPIAAEVSALSPPSIWINRKGQKPSGIVTDEEYEGLLTFITEKIAELKDPRTGKAVIPQVLRRDAIFSGPYASEAPDLVLDWWSGDGFSIKPSFPEESAKPPVEIREHEPVKEPEWGGTHRLQGIMIMQGKAVKAGAKIEGARLMDIGPTLLHLMGQPIPDDMDGRVLTDLFTEEFLKERAVQSKAAAAAPTDGVDSSAPYSEEEAAQVEERLKSLGYID